MFMNVCDCSWLFVNVRKCSWMFVNVRKCSWMFVNVRECLWMFVMFVNVCECSWMLVNVSQCSQMFVTVHECSWIRAWVSTGAKGAWHPQNSGTFLSGTRGFWQFHYIIWIFTSDWHPLFQIPNSSKPCECS